MNVPKLRFSEFSGEWERIPAEQLFENIVEKNCPAEKVLTIIQGIGTVSRDNSGRNILFDETTTDNYKKVQTGDFIIHLRSFQAGLEIANSDGIVSPAYTILRSRKTIGTTFYRNYFRSNRFINQTLCSAVEGVRDGRQISYSQFKQIPLVSTTLPEQQKIAEFLTAVDEKIKTQQNIVTNLENQKKGFMQKIFSKEICFKDENGEDFLEWEEKKFADVFSSFEYGMNAAAGEFDGTNKYIRITDIDDSSHKYIGERPVSPMGKLEDKYRVKENDILFVRTGASTGKTYLYSCKDGILYYAGFLIRGNVNTAYNSYFIFTITLLLEYDKWIYIESTRSGQPGINAQQYASYSFVCPTLPEQQKIADFLSTFDEKIDVEKQILTHWKTIKKALLQQMFV